MTEFFTFQGSEHTEAEVTGAAYPLNDLGNAQRLLLYEGVTLKRVSDLDLWYVWDEKRWRRATQDDLIEAAQRAIARMNVEARHVEDGNAHRTYARLSHNSGKIISLLTAAKGLAELRMSIDKFDANPYIFNALNCTINVPDQSWYAPSLLDYHTSLCPTDWVPHAQSPLLDTFLDRFLPDKDERTYILQSLAVACLSAGNTNRNLIILIGPTSTGKSTLIDLLKNMLGNDYTATVNPSVFRGSLDDKPRPDLLRAFGTRLLLAFEASERWELHADHIKRMTGGDPLVARAMRSDVMVEQIASFTPVIIANHPPAIRGADAALRRRLRVLVMDAEASEVDDGRLRTQLVGDITARRALLSLLFEAYRDCGGQMPQDMPPKFAAATMATYSELDEVAEILEALISEGSILHQPDASGSHCIRSLELYKCYVSWLKRYGTAQTQRDAMGPKQFSQRVLSLGYEIVRSNGMRIHGLVMGDTITTNLAKY